MTDKIMRPTMLPLLKRQLDKMANEANLGEVGLEIDASLGLEPNACADVQNKVIKLSSSMLIFPPRLLLAVLAHELAHIAQRHGTSAPFFDEYEADTIALEFLEYVGISRFAMIDLAEQFLDLDPEDTMTHPAMKKRIENMVEVAKSV